ncbi:MAG: class I SAM-dependent methyltransferase [Planctomycetota bacterium]
MKQSHKPFDEVAAHYDAWFDSEKGRTIFEREVDCLRSLMASTPGRWLEVGVGTGRFAAALGVAEGVDPSASMRALADRRGIRTADGVGECLPCPDKNFHGVLMTTTLCFLADPEKSLKECHRVLKDRGRLVVGMIPADSAWGRDYARKAAKGHPIYSAATFHTCDESLSWARREGFELEAASSCLFAPAGFPAVEGRPRKGIVEGAGFVAIAFAK